MAKNGKSNSVHWLSPNSLTVDANYENLFPEQKGIYDSLVTDMRENGWKPSSVIVAWQDGAGKGKHIVLDGHTRLRAAKEAELPRVRVELDPCPGGAEQAFARAVTEQTFRRNLGREPQCLAIVHRLIKLRKMPTRAEFVQEYGFGEATVGRATTIAKRGTHKEIAAALDPDNPVSLKETYAKILARERMEDTAEDESQERESEQAPEPPEEIEEDAPEGLMQARDLAHDLISRASRVLDLLEAETADALKDVKSNNLSEPLEQASGLIEDITAALETLK